MKTVKFLAVASGVGFATWLALKNYPAEAVLPFVVAGAVFLFFQQEARADDDRTMLDDVRWKLRHLLRNED